MSDTPKVTMSPEFQENIHEVIVRSLPILRKSQRRETERVLPIQAVC